MKVTDLAVAEEGVRADRVVGRSSIVGRAKIRRMSAACISGGAFWSSWRCGAQGVVVGRGPDRVDSGGTDAGVLVMNGVTPQVCLLFGAELPGCGPGDPLNAPGRGDRVEDRRLDLLTDRLSPGQRCLGAQSSFDFEHE